MFDLGQKNKLLGVDIGTTSIKLIELSRVGKKYRLDQCVYHPIPSGLVVTRQIQNTDGVAKELEKAVRKAKIGTNQIAICVPSSAVITKTIAMPADVGNNLESLVELEADRVVPYSLDEVNIDFQVIGPSATNPGENDVQIVACRKNVVDGFISAVEDAGLSPEVVDVDTFCFARAHRLLEGNLGGGKDTITALIDFGTNSMHMIVLKSGNIIYARETPFGGHELIESIHQKYNIAHEKVVALLQSNRLPKSYKLEILKPYIKSLIQEVLRAFQFYYSSSTGNVIEQVLLCGGTAQIGNIEKLLEKKLEIPTNIFNPFSAMKISPRVDAEMLKQNTPSCALACGLAIRGVG